MQVTHAADHITHAVIGGAKTIEFGISNDAAFFQILSSSLYSNQRLAVAREVLCNAWDAHIRAGITDRPVKVEVTDEKIVVRDYAFGIAPDMMGPLYGTYGGSDKKNNGTETGGFGLGCKSPFAYGDHFEVVSYHCGTKTIYNLSKSSADKFGKPGITPIVSIPTQETGLQVTIPLKTRGDRGVFEHHFSSVAFNGEMNVLINGQQAPNIPLSKAQGNWLLATEGIGDLHGIRIYVRYGNVIYPVPQHEEIRSLYGQVISFLNLFSGRYEAEAYKIVFQAKPDTISVTPSRESLSMQEHTIKAIREIFQDFLSEQLSVQIAKEAEGLLLTQIEYAKEQRLIGELMSPLKNLPGLKNKQTDDIKFLGNIQDLTAQYTRRNYPGTSSFYRKDMGLRIDTAIELGVGDRGTLNQVKHRLTTDLPKKRPVRVDAKGHPHYIAPLSAHSWFKKRVLRPLYRDLEASPVMDRQRLYIGDENSYVVGHLAPPHSLRYKEYGDYLSILRKVVVLTYAKKDIWHKVRYDREVLTHGSSSGVWLYHAPLSRTKINEIRKFFTDRNFIVVDWTSEVNWAKHKTYKAPVVTDEVRLPKPKLEGFPALNGVHVPNRQTRVDNCFREGAPRVDNPLFYIRVIYSKAEIRGFDLNQFETSAANIIVKLFGDVCAVVRTEPQEKKFKEQGLMELTDYVVNYVCNEVTTSPSLQAYWPECVNRDVINKSNGTVANQLLSALFDIEEVRAAFGLKSVLNSHDLMVLSLWRYLVETGVYSHKIKDNPAFIAAERHVKSQPFSRIITDTRNNANSNAFVDLLNFTKLQQILRNPSAKADGSLDRIAKLTHALLG